MKGMNIKMMNYEDEIKILKEYEMYEIEKA